MRRGFRGNGQARCVLRKGCGHYGSAKCVACPLPDSKGRVLCPRCRSPLFFVGVTEDGARWACSNVPGRGCGAEVKIPVPGTVKATAGERAPLAAAA